MENDTNDKSDESPANAFDLLSGTLQGTESSISTVSLTLKNTLERSAQMAKTMSHVMQQVFRTNVKVTTRFKSLPDGSKLIITINNATAFPIIGMTGTIDFKPIATSLVSEHMDSIPEAPKLTLESSSHYNATDIRLVDSLFISPTETATTPLANNATVVLSPNTKHVEVLCLNSPQLTRYNGVIDIQIPLPGDDDSTAIHLTNSFGIYLIDQMKKRVNTDTSMQHFKVDEGPKRSYNGQFIRDIFVMNPVMGLAKGMRFYLESITDKNELITCRIVHVSLDTGTIQVRFTGKNKKLVDLLVHELDSLDK